MSERALLALQSWRRFATTYTVTINGQHKTWAEYVSGSGYVDEERLLQPTVFPAFAKAFWGWDLQLNLAPEESGNEGKPDFTPADSVTHPFVFETKGTAEGTELEGHGEQVRRYLTDGYPRIKKVVLTSLVGVRVFDRDERGVVRERYEVNLRGLLIGPDSVVASTAPAERLANLLDDFRRQELTAADKLRRVRESPPWNPAVDVTGSEPILARLNRIVVVLTDSVADQVKSGSLARPAVTNAAERHAVLGELRLLVSRLGATASEATITDFLAADESTDMGKALRQYCSHVAYYAATRLMLVRVWEDLGLLEPMLYDGGFNRQMTRFDDVIEDVVGHSFNRARTRYRSLFEHQNNYTWYSPNETTYAEVIYELANTYLGAIRSDVLGRVYEKMLERIDRKLLGVYYTPRDIIGLIWDLIGFSAVADQAEAAGREPRVLDIATGSGGFLVEAASRLRDRVISQRAAGAEIDMQDWLDSVTEGLNGVEYQRFSAYLAELNLLVQMGQVLAADPALKIPSLGILAADTLSLHEPDVLFEEGDEPELPYRILADSEERRERASRIKAAASSDFLMDVACGNPPYIGEKLAAPLMASTRRDYPYWESYVGQHMDYLYWFLILGVSKLREGGRFGFITTEYWLRAEGAKPLRRYLAERCHIDRVVVFRDLRLFPDALGQHSMIVTGTCVVRHDNASAGDRPALLDHKPLVSIYEGGSDVADRRARVLTAIRNGRNAAQVRTFTAQRSPNALKQDSWGDLLLTRVELRQRARLVTSRQVTLKVSKGVETTVNGMSPKTEGLLPADSLAAAGGTGARAGIQLLTAAEVRRLGPLNEHEKAAVRAVANTKDVYPYAVVLPADPTSVVYLAKPDSLAASLSDEQVVGGTPFPPGMPALQRHLTRFRPILEHKTVDRGERRPWWALHRPRADVVGDATGDGTGWARYCLTTRWGGGGRLIVGLAPAFSSPASGLHVLRAVDDNVPAAYLSALYNSTLYQEIAASLPPGQLRQQDLQRIGLPHLADGTAQMAEIASSLADTVVRLVRVHGPRFPLLPDALRTDASLTDTVDDTWVPQEGPTNTWGRLAGLNWVTELTAHRAGTTALGKVSTSLDALGLRVTVDVRGTNRPAFTVRLVDLDAETAADALACRLRAVAARGGKVKDIPDVLLPVDPYRLVLDAGMDRQALRHEVQGYQGFRDAVDTLLAEAL